MGQNKSKHLSLQEHHEELGHLRRLETSKEERRRKRKWRKKQGYSLPTGMDMVGRMSAATSQPDLPDIDQDDAILMSYSQSNAEKFSHLRPNYQNRSDRESSEETVHLEHHRNLTTGQLEHIQDKDTIETNTNENKHVHVIQIVYINLESSNYKRQ
jgi:hypothetical protein